ncbi:MAG: 50S ribosomal protein L4 [Candidatus Kapaibacterium sp.]|jgi:large subunit ribosomal protein L4|nr:50S ribosomal protein L4 [Candidatus Kapabacteria bacterium]
MQVDLYSKDGGVVGQVELPDSIFAVEPNEHAMHQAVVAYLAHQRQGTAKTKIRSEVSGGGKKPWKQKGRGTARSGSTRSPVWVGGGTVHGPKPHEFVYKLPKKVSRLARKSAYSLRVAENNLVVVDDFTFSAIKTKQMASVLDKLQLNNMKTLILLPDVDSNVFMSGRNIPNVTIQPADKISTYDILNHRKILILKSAINKIENTFGN